MRELDDEELVLGDMPTTLALGVDVGQGRGSDNCGLRHFYTGTASSYKRGANKLDDDGRDDHLRCVRVLVGDVPRRTT